MRAAQADATVRAVLEATSLMAQDPGLIADVTRRMGTGVGPATAVRYALARTTLAGCERIAAAAQDAAGARAAVEALVDPEILLAR